MVKKCLLLCHYLCRHKESWWRNVFSFFAITYAFTHLSFLTCACRHMSLMMVVLVEWRSLRQQKVLVNRVRKKKICKYKWEKIERSYFTCSLPRNLSNSSNTRYLLFVLLILEMFMMILQFPLFSKKAFILVLNTLCLTLCHLHLRKLRSSTNRWHY